MSVTVQEHVRQVLTHHAKLAIDVSTLSDEDDLFQAGMTSHATVNVMLALEDLFDVEFPDDLLRRSTFESVQSLTDAVSSLQGEVVR